MNSFQKIGGLVHPPAGAIFRYKRWLEYLPTLPKPHLKILTSLLYSLIDRGQWQKKTAPKIGEHRSDKPRVSGGRLKMEWERPERFVICGEPSDYELSIRRLNKSVRMVFCGIVVH
jgi:hypothetical protein